MVVVHVVIRQHGFTTDAGLPDAHERVQPLGQIHIHTAAKADKTDAVPWLKVIILIDERQTAARHEACNITTQYSRPPPVRKSTEERSFSSDALSSDASKNLPGR